MKKSIPVFICLISLMIPAISKAQTYDPRYWIEGLFDHAQSTEQFSDEAVASKINDAYAKGWRGVTVWGADRAGSKMNYYFKCSFLEKQDWAVFKSDHLSTVVKAAHAKGMKVMINLEGVNPYHWTQNKWTPENIKAVAEDLAKAGVDAVFEECFEVKPEVFVSLARTLKSKGIDYVSGTDPMLLRESSFAALWPETGIVDIYNYYLKRDKIYNIATLAQHGSLGYGWAKFWNKPTSLISPINRNWGIASDYSPAVVPYLCMIRALQFRLDNFIIFGGAVFDKNRIQSWIKEYVDKQEKNRPTLNIVVLLNKNPGYSGGENGNTGWNRLFNSGDAITSGAMNAGYDIVVSDKVVPADAYYVYAQGGNNDVLPDDVVALFSTNKNVFIQCANSVPSGKELTSGWKTVLAKCGVDATKSFIYGAGSDGPSDASLPENQEQDIPYTGYYNNVYLRFTGSDVQRGVDLRAGTIIPKDAITGTAYCTPNKTYGKGPYIVGDNKKYLVTATSLNWEAAYPISNLLSGAGILPSSNVWGIVGKNVTALIAIETTELNMSIPGLADGSKIHVVVWDNKMNKSDEEVITYKAPFKRVLKEYDLLLIDTVK
jgi:hypothetical protein